MSDIDILVKIKSPIGLKFFELWDNLETILGVKIDLITVKAVKQKPLLWESIPEKEKLKKPLNKQILLLK